VRKLQLMLLQQACQLESEKRGERTELVGTRGRVWWNRIVDVFNDLLHFHIRLDIPLLVPQWRHFRITAAGAHQSINLKNKNKTIYIYIYIYKESQILLRCYNIF